MKLAMAVLTGILFAQPAFSQAEKGTTPIEIVSSLYKEHLAESGPLQDDKQKGWAKLFDKELLKVLKSDSGWQFDPLIFAQDSDVKKVDVSEIENSDAAVLVLVKFVNFDKPVRLIVALKKTETGYLIENISEPATGTDLINNLPQ